MSKRRILPAVCLASLLLFTQADFMEYNCTLDNSTTYEYPTGCSLHSSSDNSSLASDADHHQFSDYEELEGMAQPPVPHPQPPHPPKPPARCELSETAISLFKCCWKFEYVRIMYLSSATGLCLEDIDPSLMMNGTVVGAQRAFLSEELHRDMEQMTYSTVDQMKTLKDSIGANDSVAGMNVNISRSRCAALFDKALGTSLFPKFDCYKDDFHVMLTLYWFNALATKCYIGILEKMDGPKSTRLCGSLAATKASHETLIRSKLFEKMHASVHPYFVSTTEFTNRLAAYADRVMETNGCSDEGLQVPQCLSTGGRWENLFSLDDKGLPYGMVVNSTCEVAKMALADFIMAD